MLSTQAERGLGMKKTVLVIGVTLIASFMILGCGGGGDDEASSVGNLAGTWLGVIDDLSGTLEEFSVQIDGAGNVVDVMIGGSSTGNIGYINEDWDENLFHVRYTAGSTLQGGVMIVDSAYRYATFADGNLYIGVLEKGAASLPSYAASDIVGNYDGGAYEFVDSAGTWNWEGDAISMTTNNDLTFSGNSPSGAFFGEFNAPAFIPNYGHYAGSMDVPPAPMRTMDITALVSPDKNFVAAYAKETGTTPTLDDYLLIGLVR